MTADAIDSAGRRFELLDVRPVSCLLLDADSPECLCWVVGMLMGWRAMPKASGRVWPSPGEPMDHQDHRHFAAWMEQAS